MNATKLMAIVLIVAGALALAYGGFSYPKETHSAQIGNLHIGVQEEQRVNIPLWAGICLLVGGVALLVIAPKS